MKLTAQHLEAQIASEQFISSRDNGLSLGTLTICVLTMKNGIKVVGKSACLDERNFDAATGRDMARKDAINKLWELEGYATATLSKQPVMYVKQADGAISVITPTALPNGEVVTSVHKAYEVGQAAGYAQGHKDAEDAARLKVRARVVAMRKLGYELEQVGDLLGISTGAVMKHVELALADAQKAGEAAALAEMAALRAALKDDEPIKVGGTE